MVSSAVCLAAGGTIPQTTALTLREVSRRSVLDLNQNSVLVETLWEQSAVRCVGS